WSGSRWRCAAGTRRGQADCRVRRRAARRDFLRAAVLGLKTPFVTALSIFFWAYRKSSSVGSPASAAASTFLMAVFTSERIDLFRRRRFSFWRLRLICDLMLAMCSETSLYVGRSQKAGKVIAPTRDTAGGR